MARILAAVAVLLVGLAAASGRAPARTTCHPIGPHLLARGSLDADRAVETLAELEGPVDCAHSAFVARMEIQDMCGGRARILYVSAAYTRSEERLDSGRIVEADGLRGRREAFFVVHGATSDIGEAAVVHLRAPSRGVCSRPRFLFRYRPGSGVTSFNVELGDFSARYPGQEVRVSELVDGDRLVKMFHYDRARGRYV
jgi:hypothetical protein